MKKIALLLAIIMIFSVVNIFALAEEIGFSDDGEIGDKDISIVIPDPPIKYIITIVNDGNTISETEYNEGTIISLPSNTKSKTEYTFGGWSDGVNTYEEGDEYTVTANVTITAIWNINQYTVTIINDGDEILSEQKDYNSTFTLPSNTKTKDGYTFSGWSDGTNIYGVGDDYTVVGNVIFTAIWDKSPAPQTILYGDVNGNGSITISDLTKLKNYFANYDYTTGKSTVTISEGADCNGNGSIAISDLTKLKNYFANYDYSTGTSTVTLGPKK